MPPAFVQAAHSSGFTMKDDKQRGEAQAAMPAKNPGKPSRQDRLKLALRENLKRRKSQARGRSELAAAPSDPGGASPYGDGNKPGE
jgi:hypothetical protein